MKRYSDASLMRMTKRELIEIVRMSEHNEDVAKEALAQQAENIKDWEPVVHCRDCKRWKRADGAWSDGTKLDWGRCRRFVYADSGDDLQTTGGYFCCGGDRRRK